MPMGRFAGVVAVAGALALAAPASSLAVPFTPKGFSNASKVAGPISEFVAYADDDDGGFDVRRYVESVRTVLLLAKSSGAWPNGSGWLPGAVTPRNSPRATTAAMSLVSTQDTGGPFTPGDGSGILGDEGPFFVVVGGSATDTVPLPPGILLLGSAAGMLVFLRRRRVSSV